MVQQLTDKTSQERRVSTKSRMVGEESREYICLRSVFRLEQEQCIIKGVDNGKERGVGLGKPKPTQSFYYHHYTSSISVS